MLGAPGMPGFECRTFVTTWWLWAATTHTYASSYPIQLLRPAESVSPPAACLDYWEPHAGPAGPEFSPCWLVPLPRCHSPRPWEGRYTIYAKKKKRSTIGRFQKTDLLRQFRTLTVSLWALLATNFKALCGSRRRNSLLACYKAVFQELGDSFKQKFIF